LLAVAWLLLLGCFGSKIDGDDAKNNGWILRGVLDSSYVLFGELRASGWRTDDSAHGQGRSGGNVGSKLL